MVYVLIFTRANMKNVHTSIFLIWYMFYRFHMAINHKCWSFSGSFSSSWTLNIGVFQSHAPVLPYSSCEFPDILMTWSTTISDDLKLQPLPITPSLCQISSPELYGSTFLLTRMLYIYFDSSEPPVHHVPGTSHLCMLPHTLPTSL